MPLRLLVALGLCWLPGCALHSSYYEAIDPESGVIVGRFTTYDANLFRVSDTALVLGVNPVATVAHHMPLQERTEHIAVEAFYEEDEGREPDLGKENLEPGDLNGIEGLLGDKDVALAMTAKGLRPFRPAYDLSAVGQGIVYVTRDHEVSEEAAKVARNAAIAWVLEQLGTAGVDDLFGWLKR